MYTSVYESNSPTSLVCNSNEYREFCKDTSRLEHTKFYKTLKIGENKFTVTNANNEFIYEISMDEFIDMMEYVDEIQKVHKFLLDLIF